MLFVWLLYFPLFWFLFSLCLFLCYCAIVLFCYFPCFDSSRAQWWFALLDSGSPDIPMIGQLPLARLPVTWSIHGCHESWLSIRGKSTGPWRSRRWRHRNIWIWSMVPLILKSGILALTVISLVVFVTSRTLAADLGNPLPLPLLDQIIIKPFDIQWSRGTLWSDAAVVIPWLPNILDKSSDKYYALDHGGRYQCGWSLWRTQLLGTGLARRLSNQRSSTMPRWNASIRVLPVSLKECPISTFQD